jgi:hypothetical protein
MSGRVKRAWHERSPLWTSSRRYNLQKIDAWLGIVRKPSIFWYLKLRFKRRIKVRFISRSFRAFWSNFIWESIALEFNCKDKSSLDHKTRRLWPLKNFKIELTDYKKYPYKLFVIKRKQITYKSQKCSLIMLQDVTNFHMVDQEIKEKKVLSEWASALLVKFKNQSISSKTCQVDWLTTSAILSSTNKNA